MDVKIEGKLNSSASEAIADHARPLYDKPGASRVGIIELRSDYNVSPSPGSEKKAAVALRISGLEIAGPDQEGAIREAQKQLYLQRTAKGTLNEQGQIELAQDTIRLLGDVLNDIELARLRAAVDHWTAEMKRAVHSTTLTDGEIRHELDRIHEGLVKALHPARDNDE